MTVGKTIASTKRLLNPKRLWYLRLARSGKPLTQTLRSGFTFQLLPEGQIAEYMYTMRFEADLLALFESFVQQGMNIVDIGANSGLYSVIGAKKVGQKGHVWAFEPAIDSAARFMRNMQVNDISNVTLAKVALGDIEKGSLNLVNEVGNGDGYRYILKRKSAAGLAEKNKVSVTTLDAYLKKAGNPKVDFIKIDVEGSEFDVLTGAVKTLQANKNVVVLFESASVGLERAGHTQKKLHDYLLSLGFKLFAWNDTAHKWESDPKQVNAIGNVWAVRDEGLLPMSEVR